MVCLFVLLGLAGCSNSTPTGGSKQPTADTTKPPRKDTGLSRPSLVGRWQAVQGAIAWGYEVIQFREDSTLTLTSPGNPFPVQGRYSVSGNAFSCTLNMLQGERKLTRPILALTDSRFVLQTAGIGVPRPRDMVYWRTDSEDNLRKRLAGVWRGGPAMNQETLAFTADGILESDSGKGLERTVYRIAGKNIELAKLAPPNSFQVIRLGLLSLTNAELVLGINNKPAVYRRVK
jgi:hypothetical protein